MKNTLTREETLITAQNLGLSPQETGMILDILGRNPTVTELGIFSVMWSEHCSYKCSKPELKKFPTTGPGVLVKAGEENAGIIDIGDGWAVCFKIESHNHPSAIEPFQGAATGVGGIIRDIFTMGARPIILANSLRFGEIRGHTAQAAHNRRLFSGVVAGIAHYGNCIGLPTVAGEITFDPAYEGNPLVNVFCLGVLKHTDIRLGRASGPGNPVIYVGAKTGRDGVAGASFASRDLTEESKKDRPAVQVGDPFTEKLLMEACLELFRDREAVVGIQDMGAAGLTCSTCETASRGGTGIDIELDHVPQRETGLDPFSIMLSESQERMLIIAKRGLEQRVLDVFKKWDLDAATIGTVTSDGLMRVRHHGEIVAEIPARRLAEEAPIYHLPSQPSATATAENISLPEMSAHDYSEALTRLLASPTIASKRWVYRQFDHMVRLGTVLLPGHDAAVIRIPIFDELNDSPRYKHIALSLDCNGHLCALDPCRGAQLAVYESARNLACVGARPIGLTDNLNFGNPHNPEVFWQLQQATDGLADACRRLGIPVTGGNVSLYNQSPLGPIDPTPTVAIAGLIDDPSHITPSHFPASGLDIWLLGHAHGHLGGSQFCKEILGKKHPPCPDLDPVRELALHQLLRELATTRAIASAHDCSEGGLAVALAESCFHPDNPVGAHCDLTALLQDQASTHHSCAHHLTELLFNEFPSRAIVSAHPQHHDTILTLAHKHNTPATKIGNTATDDTFTIITPTHKISNVLSELIDVWSESLEKIMQS
jgi:phosphoribosylformylglycinamidine synthase II